MIELYEHNKIAYKSVLAMLAETGKAAVIHPTGTGKSFIAFKLCEDFPNKTVCWLSPSEYIFKTQIENLKMAAGGYEPKNIRFFTYAKLMNMEEDEIEEIQPDYILLDEFHRGGAQRWQTGIENLLEMYPDVPMLGLSATNIRYLDNQRDMANELFDGNVASEMTLGEAIVRGILNPPKYVLSAYSYQKDLEKYKRRIKSIRGKAAHDAAEKYLEALRRALEKADGLDEIFDRYMTDRTGKYIVFCANYEHMEEMMEKSREWFAKVDPDPHMYYVYSLDSETEKSFDEFKEDHDSMHLRLLFCIDVLNEGIHMEDISGVILLRPTVSPIIYKQQIGRAMSAGANHDAVVFDIVMNIDNLYSIGEIEDEMQIAAAYYRDLGEDAWIVNERFRVVGEVQDCIKLFEKLNDTLTASWNIMYAHAKAYYEQYGNLQVSSRYRTEDGYSLGKWVFNQRNIRNGTCKGTLSEKQIEKLDRIGMVWENILDVRWERNFEAARKYFEEYGELNVPISYISPTGVALGRWLAGLRRWEKANVHSKYITEERKRQLNGIGMIWDVLDYFWERNYSAAYEFYQEHRHLNVPTNYVSKEGIRLSAWLTSQRKLRNGTQKRGTPPSPEQIERLDQIGMDWNSRVDTLWETAFEAAKVYAEENGNLLVPVKFIAQNGVKLGSWIQRQRRRYVRGELPDGRKRRLDMIGMAWETPDPWLTRYEAVRRYYAEKKTVRIPQDYVVDHLWIGKWLFQQKKAYDDGKLSQEKRKLLEGLPLHELESGDPWSRVYDDLKTYYEENGNLNVPTGYSGKSGTNLNTWLITQRRKRRLGKLSFRQIGALDCLGFDWEPQNGWNNGYRHAKAYYEKYGNLKLMKKYVCADGFRLGAWIFSRRAEYSEHSPELTVEQIQALDQIGMVWETTERWEQNYERVKKYAQNHSCLPERLSAVTQEEREIAIWLESQRVCFRQGRLSREHLEKLKELKPEIVADVRTPFDEGYANALEYYRSNGNLDVPASYQCENGFWLGAWIKSQRKKKNALSEKQAAQLDAIGMIWHPKSQWESQFEKAEQYFAEHGQLPIEPKACETKNELSLYQWLKKQRKKASNGELSEEQIRRLSEIGMEWRTPNERAWDRGYREAAGYYAKNGNLNVTVSYVCADGYPLGEWIHTQRKSRNQMPKDRLAKLASIGAVKI